MQEKTFNLVEEPWIRVALPDLSVREVSLSEALTQAHNFRALGGELPTQDVAVLRLLLAVVHTVFTRVDAQGRNAPVETADDALLRWKELWELGSFPAEPIEHYLAQWRERFWLFHPERPFCQAPSAQGGTAYGASKLNGEVSESGNKIRLFPGRAGAGKESVTYPEAARWLLYVNAFDDTSSKPKGKDLPSPGAGWLGKLGLICADGGSLFETLLLNCVLCRDDAEPWAADRPSWELEALRAGERTEIPLPEDQASLLTLQSRRLLLRQEGGAVTGFTLLGGDFFPKLNAVTEQMTVWTRPSDKKEAGSWQPRRHDPARQMWRDYAAYFVEHGESLRPGVVRWVDMLKRTELLGKRSMITFRIAGVRYGDKDFFVSDMFSDSLSFHLGLLTELGAAWQARIEEEIASCDRLAQAAGRLADDLAQAAGGEAGAAGEAAKRQLYHRLDEPFRRWLAALDPQNADQTADALLRGWRDTAADLTRRLGQELVESAGPAAFTGRYVTKKIKNKEETRHYSAPEAYNWFLYNISKIYSS